MIDNVQIENIKTAKINLAQAKKMNLNINTRRRAFVNLLINSADDLIAAAETNIAAVKELNLLREENEALKAALDDADKQLDALKSKKSKKE